MTASYLVFFFFFFFSIFLTKTTNKPIHITYSLANIKLNIRQIFFLDLKNKKYNIIIFLIIFFANHT
jgi:hypothetical protein